MNIKLKTKIIQYDSDSDGHHVTNIKAATNCLEGK